MKTYIALLRAVNVGGRKPAIMAELRGLLTDLGFVNARSLLQTGNLVFRSKARNCPELERLLEEEAEKRLDLHTDFLVRTAEEWETIVANNPFRDEARRDPGHLVVMFLKRAPGVIDIEALQATIKGPEIVRADGRQVYMVYPAGIGRSRLTHTIVEKKLGARGTARNWNTVLKLASFAEN